jgi:hypothetical protein
MDRVRRIVGGWVLALLVGAAASAGAHTPVSYPEEELDRLLAPVALYPDALLAQVLMASTYPLEVGEAARWADRNPGLRGEALDRALEDQPWDPSVKALVHYPGVIDMLSEEVDWTERLGEAVLAAEAEVMAAVQRLRWRAYEAGRLRSTREQRVIIDSGVIVIEPADPGVVYVPVYDSLVVYGTWRWPRPPYCYQYRPRDYPPWSVLRPGYSFSVAVVVTHRTWSGFDWRRRHIHVDRRGHPVPRAQGSRSLDPVPWHHDPRHRHGPQDRYRGPRERFGDRQAGGPPRPGDGRKAHQGTPGVAGPSTRPEGRPGEPPRRRDEVPARRVGPDRHESPQVRRGGPGHSEQGPEGRESRAPVRPPAAQRRPLEPRSADPRASAPARPSPGVTGPAPGRYSRSPQGWRSPVPPPARETARQRAVPAGQPPPPGEARPQGARRLPDEKARGTRRAGPGAPTGAPGGSHAGPREPVRTAR